MDSEASTVIGIALVMLVGLLGVVAPFVPGLPLIWGAAVLYGFQTEWDTAAWVAMTAISLLMVGGITAKIVLPSRRVTESGAPSSTLLAGGLGGVVGFFVIPVVGLPLGAIAGVLLAEYRRTGEWSKAWTSTKGAVIGFGIGALIELGAGLTMIVAWVAWVFAT